MPDKKIFKLLLSRGKSNFTLKQSNACVFIVMTYHYYNLSLLAIKAISLRPQLHYMGLLSERSDFRIGSGVEIHQSGTQRSHPAK